MRLKFIKIFSLLILILFVFACDDEVDNASNFKLNNKENIYKKDNTLQQIVAFQQNNDVESLIPYLNSKNPNYQIHSLYVLASLKDTSAVFSVMSVLNDENLQVRNAAAYALGSFGSNYVEQKLFESYNAELEPLVKKTLLEAIGKCGTEKSVNFVASLNIADSESSILEGQARAFYYLASKGYISQLMIDRTMYVLENQKISESVKLQYSYLLTVEKDLNITKSFSTIKYGLESSKNVFLLSNLALSLKHIRGSESLEILKNIIQSEADYRVKISAIEALYYFDYYSAKDVIFDALQSKNASLAVAASEYILKKGNSNDVQKYLNFSSEISSMQARSNLYRAALFFAVQKKPITDKIVSGYNVTNNIYEKASLLYALSADPRMYKFVKDETFSTKSKIISTEGIKALYLMRLHPKFDEIAWVVNENTGEDLYLEYKIIFNEAMTSGDNAMIYYAAKIMNIPEMKYFDEFTNTFFLTQTLNSLVIPRDLLAYKTLCETNNKFGTQTCPQDYKINPFEMDWEFILSISGNQRVSVETNKGTFEITLDVNSAPAEVGVFFSLVKQAYYDDTYFYKNVPNSAIVSGGKRGDGWMNMNIPLISEFKNKRVQDGSVAMSIIKDDYLSTNWFVATSESIDFDDKYSPFGQVTSGLDVVHQLEVGDVIYHIKPL